MKQFQNIHFQTIRNGINGGKNSELRKTTEGTNIFSSPTKASICIEKLVPHALFMKGTGNTSSLLKNVLFLVYM